MYSHMPLWRDAYAPAQLTVQLPLPARINRWNKIGEFSVFNHFPLNQQVTYNNRHYIKYKQWTEMELLYAAEYGEPY